MELGNNIAALRKARGLTQEQLGGLLGISGQAVSKWENGGAPDAELLPAIADCLGATIDSLYGRNSASGEDISGRLLGWLASLPPERRMYELFVFLNSVIQRPYHIDSAPLNDLMDSVTRIPLKNSCSTRDINGESETIWLRAGMVFNEGIQLSVPAEDCPMFLLMPEPEEGYDGILGDNEGLRLLFSALALPGALEILRDMYARKPVFRSVGSIAKASGVTPEDAAAALSALVKCNILKMNEVELEDGPIETYSLFQLDAFLPFMLFARWMCDKSEAYIFHCYDRNRPLLRGENNEK